MLNKRFYIFLLFICKCALIFGENIHTYIHTYIYKQWEGFLNSPEGLTKRFFPNQNSIDSLDFNIFVYQKEKNTKNKIK